ncbi:hypothetical protein, partial [Spirosoma daeguense]
MNKIYTLGLTLVLAVFFFNNSYSQTAISGTISGTLTKANSPYLLNGAVTVPSGQTLIIAPGVTIEAPAYNASLQINGTLLAQG